MARGDLEGAPGEEVLEDKALAAAEGANEGGQEEPEEFVIRGGIPDRDQPPARAGRTLSPDNRQPGPDLADGAARNR
jgi:hypothetical protein